VNSHSPSSEIINSQHTADDIPAHAIEHQDLPDRIAIFIQDRGGLGDKAPVSRRLMGIVICGLWIMIQIQQLLD
jgi:hypothetical protein